MASSIVSGGNVTAGLCSVALANMDPNESWKYLFLIGATPAFLCIFIMVRLREPEKWVRAKAASKRSVAKQWARTRVFL